MGDEFCKGCKDCTGNDNEGDFSKTANLPITHLNEGFYQNNNANISVNDNSILNNTSFLGNYNNKADNAAVSTINSKFPYNEGNINNYNNLKDYNDMEGQRNYYDNNLVNQGKKSLRNSVQLKSLQTIAYENNIDYSKLEEIITNYNLKIIVKAFRKLKKIKKEKHKEIHKEYSFLSGSEYVKGNDDDLDVDLVPDKNYCYLGHKFNNKKDGLGLEIFSDSNAKYFGSFLYGKRVYYARFIIKNDFKSYSYKGEIKGIYADGYGLLDNKSAHTKYEGMWKGSKKNGYGIEYYKDKSCYKGEFSNGKKHGIGYYKWTDNSSYKGEWGNNMLEGYGIYKFNDGSIYKGQWKGNRMNGLGEFSFPNVKTYIGFFSKDTRNGFGILIWYKETKAFIGFWSGNKQNGLGKFISDGKIRYGCWEEGKLNEKIKTKELFYSKLNSEQKAYSPYFQLDDYDQITNCINKILKDS